MRAEIFLVGLVSCLIVAFSQPSFAPWLGPIAAAMGYALFWRAIAIYPFWHQRFWRAGVWFTSISLIQLSWMSSIEFQGFYILFVWLALSIGVGLQFGLLTLFIPYDRPPTFPRILAIASAWVLFEWSRFFFLCGYSWNLSGLSLSNPYAIQLASVFGVLGLSFWVIFTNLVGLRALKRKGIPNYAVWLLVAAFPYLFGVAHLGYHQRGMEKNQKAPFSCLLVQTGLLPSERTYLGGRDLEYLSPYYQWERILHLLKHQKSADLLVLPESAVPFMWSKCVYDQSKVDRIFFKVFGPDIAPYFPKEAFPYQSDQKVSNAYWVQTLSNFFGSEVIIGLDHEDETGKSFSSAFYVNPQGSLLERYDKRILCPMVEYLPFSFLASLAKIYGITSFFSHGEEAKVFYGKLPLSVSICYEETFPQNVREGRLKGAKMLINVTNDGWYPYSLLPSQHFEHARFRAVENGAPLLRACNTGISAAVDSLGRAVGKLEERKSKEKKLQAGVLYVELNPYDYPTLFTLWGNGGILSLCCICLGGFLILKKELHW